MHKRDVGILLLACIAMVVSLQRDSMFSFRKAWYWTWEDSGEDELVPHHTLPPPVVADLNGDGHYEVIVASPSLTIQVIQPAPASSVASGFAAGKLISQVSLLQRTVTTQASRRPVAMAVGHIDPAPQHGKGVLAHRKQVLVVVTAGLKVLCYDHNLKLMWEKDISGGQLQRHSRVKEVSVHVTPHQVTAGDRGLIVVGSAIQKGDLASGEGVDVSGQGPDAQMQDNEDVFATMQRKMQAEAAHAHSAGAKDTLENIDDAGPTGVDAASSLRGLDVSRHFNYHGLEGATGQERWHHTATDFHKDLPELASGLMPQNDYRLDAEKLEGRHFGEASCRQYRESILHAALPHSWDTVHDTKMVEAHFVKHKVGKGGTKNKLATRDAKGRRAHPTGSTGHHPPVHSAVANLISGRHAPTGAHGAGTPGGRSRRHHANVTVNALVVHLEEGIEVIHLFTGRTICQLHLPAKQLHVDINGDGVMDHVQVYKGSDVSPSNDGTLLSSDAGGRRHHAATHCTALTTSGIPPQHRLWQANVCRTNRFLSGMGRAGAQASTLFGGAGGQGSEADGIEILTPVFLPLARLNKGFGGSAHHHGLTVVLNSQGELVALSARGTPIWQGSYENLQWTARHESEMDAQEAAAGGTGTSQPTLMAISLHRHGVPGTILAAGENGAVLVSEHGRELASLDFPTAPTQRLVVADFNGDGLNDIIEITPVGAFAWAQVQHVGGNTLSMLLAVATVAMALLLWNSNTMASTGGAKKLRSTEYTD